VRRVVEGLLSVKNSLSGGGKDYIVRVIEAPDYRIINVCDEEVFGLTLKEKDLEIHISKEFYGGERVGEEELMELLRSASIINLTGRRCVDLAVSRGFAHKDAVKKVKNVSFLMIFKFMRG